MGSIDNANVEILLGDFGVANARWLSNSDWGPRAQAYRRMTSARMQPLDVEGMKTRIPKGEYFISRKLDGEFTMLIWDGERVAAVNPGMTVRVGAPCFAEAAKLLKKAKVKSALLACELYWEKPDGGRERVHDVVRVARKPESAADVERLRVAIFDLMEIDGEPASKEYAETWALIQKWFKGGKTAHAIETVEGDQDTIESKFKEWVEEQGSEGLVLRSDAAGLFKIKPRRTLDAVVIGFSEGIDDGESDRRNMLHDLLLALARPDGALQLIGRVGGGFTDEQRREMFSDLKDQVVESDYTEVNPDCVAYEMVRPDWVVEITCLDVIAISTRNATIDKMALRWNAAAEKYETLRRMPSVSVISPVFQRRREDKTRDPDDTGLRQLTELVEIRDADKTMEDMALPGAKVLKRQVAVKELKGKKMVRKMLLWKTNKEDRSDDHFAYVLYLTDFSPNRKDPLKRDLRVSNDEAQIKKMWDEWIQENFEVRGWKPVE